MGKKFEKCVALFSCVAFFLATLQGSIGYADDQKPAGGGPTRQSVIDGLIFGLAASDSNPEILGRAIEAAESRAGKMGTEGQHLKREVIGPMKGIQKVQEVLLGKQCAGESLWKQYRARVMGKILEGAPCQGEPAVPSDSVRKLVQHYNQMVHFNFSESQDLVVKDYENEWGEEPGILEQKENPETLTKDQERKLFSMFKGLANEVYRKTRESIIETYYKVRLEMGVPRTSKGPEASPEELMEELMPADAQTAILSISGKTNIAFDGDLMRTLPRIRETFLNTRRSENRERLDQQTLLALRDYRSAQADLSRHRNIRGLLAPESVSQENQRSLWRTTTGRSLRVVNDPKQETERHLLLEGGLNTVSKVVTPEGLSLQQLFTEALSQDSSGRTVARRFLEAIDGPKQYPEINQREFEDLVAKAVREADPGASKEDMSDTIIQAIRTMPIFQFAVRHESDAETRSDRAMALLDQDPRMWGYETRRQVMARKVNFTKEEFDKKLLDYYRLTQEALEKLDEIFPDPVGTSIDDYRKFLQGAIRHNPGGVALALVDNPEMAGALCILAVGTERQDKFDEAKAKVWIIGAGTVMAGLGFLSLVGGMAAAEAALIGAVGIEANALAATGMFVSAGAVIGGARAYHNISTGLASYSSAKMRELLMASLNEGEGDYVEKQNGVEEEYGKAVAEIGTGVMDGTFALVDIAVAAGTAKAFNQLNARIRAEALQNAKLGVTRAKTEPIVGAKTEIREIVNPKAITEEIRYEKLLLAPDDFVPPARMKIIEETTLSDTKSSLGLRTAQSNRRVLPAKSLQSPSEEPLKSDLVEVTFSNGERRHGYIELLGPENIRGRKGILVDPYGIQIGSQGRHVPHREREFYNAGEILEFKDGKWRFPDGGTVEVAAQDVSRIHPEAIESRRIAPSDDADFPFFDPTTGTSGRIIVIDGPQSSLSKHPGRTTGRLDSGEEITYDGQNWFKADGTLLIRGKEGAKRSSVIGQRIGGNQTEQPIVNLDETQEIEPSQLYKLLRDDIHDFFNLPRTTETHD